MERAIVFCSRRFVEGIPLFFTGDGDGKGGGDRIGGGTNGILRGDGRGDGWGEGDGGVEGGGQSREEGRLIVIMRKQVTV